MDVTCIIPVHNGQKTIKAAVDSALANPLISQVLVFNDSSTDSTDDILFGYELAFPDGKVSILTLGLPFPSGVNTARNFLINEAKDGLIIPLDADDTLRDIRPFVEAYEPNTFIYGDYYIEDVTQTPYMFFGAPVGTLSRKNITGISMLFHRNDWIKAGGYNPDFAYAEDWAFQCALVNAGVQGKHVSETLITCKRDSSNYRTFWAGQYWSFYREMAHRLYAAPFAVNH